MESRHGGTPPLGTSFFFVVGVAAPKAPPYMGGCQNYGPFLGPYIIRHLIFRIPKN